LSDFVVRPPTAGEKVALAALAIVTNSGALLPVTTALAAFTAKNVSRRAGRQDGDRRH